MALCLLPVCLYSCHDEDKPLYHHDEKGTISIDITEDPYNVPGDGGYYSFSVGYTGMGEWGIECEDEWVTFNPDSGTESSIVFFCVEKNEDFMERSTIVKVYDKQIPENAVYFTIEQFGTTPDINGTLDGQMLRQHRMGYGYDIMKGFSDDDSFSDEPILDYDECVKCENKIGSLIISEELRHKEEIDIFSGNTTTELKGELTKSEYDKATFCGCGKETTTNTSILKTKTINQSCALIRLKQIVTSRTVDMGNLSSQVTTDNSHLYSQEFRTAINKVTNQEQALTFISNFGTHFVVSADLGGNIQLRVTIQRTNTSTHETTATTVAKKVFGAKVKKSSYSSEKFESTDDVQFDFDYQVQGGTEYAKEQIAIPLKAKEEVSTELITDWQKSFNMYPSSTNSYNLATCQVRLVPIYDLIKDSGKKALIKAAYLKYTNSTVTEPVQDKDECFSISPFSIDELGKGNRTRSYFDSNNITRAIICRESVYSIDRDNPVVVIYPVINGTPYFTDGIFLGNKKHAPGKVAWYGTTCMYYPNDSIKMSNTKYKDYFDSDGQLKNVYLYHGSIWVEAPSAKELKDKMCVLSNSRTTTKTFNFTMEIADTMYYDVKYEGQSYANVLNEKLKNKVTTMPLVKVGPLLWTETEAKYEVADDVAKNYTIRKNSLFLTQKIGFIDNIWKRPYISKDNEANYLTKTRYLLQEGFTKYLPTVSQAQTILSVLEPKQLLLDSDGVCKCGLNWPSGEFSFIMEPVRQNNTDNTYRCVWKKEEEDTAHPYFLVPCKGSSTNKGYICRLSQSGATSAYHPSSFFVDREDVAKSNGSFFIFIREQNITIPLEVKTGDFSAMHFFLCSTTVD